MFSNEHWYVCVQYHSRKITVLSANISPENRELVYKKLGGWETSEKGKKVRRPPNESGDMESLIEPPPPPPPPPHTHTESVVG